MSTLIGLAGYARTGKDTVALILAEHGYQRAAFADPIRDALLALNPLICRRPGYRLDQVIHGPGDWDYAKDHYPLVREMLQRLGTDVGRGFFGQDCWVRAAFDRLPPGRVVFTDVRFPNEADAVHDHGGQVWRVNRHGYGPTNGHVSETAMDGYDVDWHVWNTGTIEALRSQVFAACDGLVG